MIVLLETGGQSGRETGALADGEHHHLRVRRARDGEPVELRDGAGLVGTGRLVRVGRDWRVEVEAARVIARPPALTLAVGAGDRERFEWLVEKATELGVTCIVPIETERTHAVATRVRSEHLERLRRRALEAVKQCGAPWAPEVTPPERLTSFLSRRHEGQRWVGDPEGGAASAPPDGALTVVIGPEGGLTDPERRAASAAGFHPVRLGPHTLRFETAAIAAAALAMAGRLTALGGTDG